MAFGSSAPLSGRPRPLSEAERMAVQYAAEFLSGGPPTIHERLSASSPLRKLDRAAALREIEVRTGPNAGAHWELQTVVPSLKDRAAAFTVTFPSGIDDTVIFSMVAEGGTYRIGSIRTLAEPVAVAVVPPVSEGSAPRRHPRRKAVISLFLGLLGGGLAFTAIVLRYNPMIFGEDNAATLLRYSQKLFRAGVVAAAVFFIGGYALSARILHRTEPPAAPPPKPRALADAPRPLGDLLALRRALSAGEVIPDFGRELENRTGTSRDVLLAWKAQIEVQQSRLEDAEATLALFPLPARIPMVELLRGRVAFAQAREGDSVLAYERAVNLGPGRDQLWLETAAALAILGFEKRSDTFLERLDRMGARQAAAYYELAVREASHARLDPAKRLVMAAWKLEPWERKELLSSPEAWELLKQPWFASIVRLNSAIEPQVISAGLGLRPISLPAGGSSSVCGDTLLIEIDRQTLRVVGGGSLAPAGSGVEDASDRRRREERIALERFPELQQAVAKGGAAALLQPALRHQIEQTSAALAARNRWENILEITRGVTGAEEHIPFTIAALRGAALRRSGRIEDAQQLAVRLSENPALRRKRSPWEMVAVGELLASVKLYKPAVRMFDQAMKIHDFPNLDERARSLLMRDRLASAYKVYRSGFFAIRYSPEVDTFFVQRMAQILEAERRRIASFIPVERTQTIVVNLVEWKDFRSTLTASDYVVGLYDGEITVPLVGATFDPNIVAILTHELAHALVAQATNDQAPHWFQEGMAQRVEMLPYHRNAFNMYDDEHIYAVPLIEPILTSAPDILVVTQSYILSQTVIRFVEERYGVAGLHRFVSAFREGATTEEAIATVTGGSAVQFDRELRHWGFVGARNAVFENPEPVRYDLWEDDAERRSRPRPMIDARSVKLKKPEL